MLKDQKSVSQKFNSTSSIATFNKRNSPQIDGFMRKKNFEAPPVVSKRGDIFGHNKQTKNVVKPTLYINNSTKKTTGADLANVRPSFRKSDPVRYYSDFTIISALENAHRAGKFHLDVGSIDRLKDYLRDNEKEPNKNINKIPDITPTPKIIPYTPNDAPIPSAKKPIEIPNSDPGILPTPPPPSGPSNNWKTAAKWAGILAAVGGFAALTYDQFKGLFQAAQGNNNGGNPDPFGVWENDGVGRDEYARLRFQPEPNWNPFGVWEDDGLGLDVQPDLNLPQYEPHNPMMPQYEPHNPMMHYGPSAASAPSPPPPAQNPNLYDEADVDLADFSSGDEDNGSLEHILGRAVDNKNEDMLDEKHVDTEVLNTSMDYARVTQINERKNYRDENYFNIDKLRNGIHTDINNNPNLSNEEKFEKIQEWLHRRDRKKRADLLEYENSEGKSIVQILWEKTQNAFSTPKKQIKKPASKNPKTPKKPRRS